MMPRYYRPGQVVKIPPTSLAVILLPIRLGRISSLLGDLCRVTMRTPDPLRPAEFAHRLVAFVIGNQLLDIEHCGLRSSPRQGEVAYPILQLRKTLSNCPKRIKSLNIYLSLKNTFIIRHTTG